MDGFVYWVSWCLGWILFPLFFRLRRLGFRQVPPGPYLLVCNHISHFDPPFLAMAMPRRLDYMTMLELFKNRFIALWLKGIGAYPVNRSGHDYRAVRTTFRRLRRGRIVGMFPEGGIVTGPESIIEGAPLGRSTAAFAHRSGCPVRVCLVLGSDQLYDWRLWFRRPTVYVVFGEELHCDPTLSRRAARQRLTEQVEASFRTLYQQLLSQHKITQEELPCTAQERWAR